MIKAVLLDLDDTLLDNKNGNFVSAYLKEAETFFYRSLRFQGMSQALIESMKFMQESDDYTRVNTKTAVKAIADIQQQNMATLLEAFEAFYADAYPALRQHTAPVKGNHELVHELMARDLAVVIATNPVYPASAIYQRLEWAGLPTDASHYAFITTGDNMHFIKPDPRYYAEILARVGVEPDEAVMVGDSWQNDIAPANQMGMHTYHITQQWSNNTHRGTLANFLQAVRDRNWLNSQPVKPLSPAMIAPELSGNIGALFGLLDEVKPHQWTQHPDPNEWSIIQIIYHLYEREYEVQRPRLQRILNEDNPFLAVPTDPLDPDEARCIQQEGPAIARAFAEEREKTIAFLRSIDDSDWRRPARHSIFSETTLLEMSHFTAQHDRMHLTQLCQTLGNCD